ncbi:hypothetical protein [Serratia ureilytica]|uniref:hypothetical protein n=1 Tax=Serratia ureilytica TaxID=300181 RepID=UPI0006276250|nr:hypothetical protein [Serratia ureilytica]
MKKPIAVAIAALYPRHNHIQDFHVLAHLNRVRALAWGGRRSGKTYAARQQELSRAAFKLSTGATLRLLHSRRKQSLMDRMVGYDHAKRGAEKSVECVFWRDPDTGSLTLLSAENGPRKWRNSPWFYFDEWPWA